MKRELSDSPLYMRSIVPALWSRHIADLIFSFMLSVFVLALFLSVIWSFAPNSPQEAGTVSATLIAASVASFGAWLTFFVVLYGKATARLGTIDLISYEIISVCRVISAMRIVDGFISLYSSLRPKNFADTAREEQYFEQFHREGKSIGDLNRYDIARISEFYIYLKASRDATLSLRRWADNDGNPAKNYSKTEKKADVNAVIYSLFLSIEAGCYAVMSLRSNEEFEFFLHVVHEDLQKMYAHLTTELSATNDPRIRFLEMERRKHIMNTKGYDEIRNAFLKRSKCNHNWIFGPISEHSETK